MADDRPTHAEKADAADRYIEAVDEAVASVHKAMTILRERQDRSGTGYLGPLFSLADGRLYSLLDKARDDLWAAHKEAASYAYDQHRAASKEAVDA